MNQNVYDKLIAKYEQLGYPALLGEPGHFLVMAILSVWRERGYPVEFRVGNSTLSERCGTVASNIPKLRERVLKECKLDNKAMILYKSKGRSRPGEYKVNPAVLVEMKEEVGSVAEVPIVPESIARPETARDINKKMWDTVPFKNGLPLNEGGGISQNQLEKLNSFGLRYLRTLDRRYYTPSSQDTELLYELFLEYSPRQILKMAKKAHKANIDNVLVWIGEGAEVEQQS